MVPYFPNLNGLRFVAALVVVLHHVAMQKAELGYASAWDSPVVRQAGGLAVTFFFVLSGFLITHLLLKERAEHGRVDVGRFYLRRVLRIWPLYFGVVALAFAVVPGWLPGTAPWPGFGVLALYLFFLPNFLAPSLPTVPYAGHLWSIGVEEQFYLLWPWLVRRGVDVAQLCALAVLWFLVLRSGMQVAVQFLHVGGEWVPRAQYLLERTRIDCMAMGGLGAAWLAAGKARALLARPVFWGACLAVPLLLWTDLDLWAYRTDVFAALFLVLIAQFAYRPEAVPNLERRPLVYLGKISYGLYMLHPFAIGLCLAVMRRLAPAAIDWGLAPAAVALTVVLA
ncbi:MAG: hypothetical protein JWM80_2256, partial [Cyanobacteria bacterium RYN_339]|nr:hypothetical protein [Cyanobacteria bacterium RYN_339]